MAEPARPYGDTPSGLGGLGGGLIIPVTAFDVVAYCDVHGLETGTIITNIDGPQLPMLFMDRTGLEVVSLDPVSSARRRFGGFGQ